MHSTHAGTTFTYSYHAATTLSHYQRRSQRYRQAMAKMLWLPQKRANTSCQLTDGLGSRAVILLMTQLHHSPPGSGFQSRRHPAGCTINFCV
jgi:hypothetical protein